jgi:hypothetical protein
MASVTALSVNFAVVFPAISVNAPPAILSCHCQVAPVVTSKTAVPPSQVEVETGSAAGFLGTELASWATRDSI